MRPNSPMISWKWITGFGFISISFVSWWIRFWVTLYQVSTNRRAKECCARAHAFVLFTVGRECVKIINIKWTSFFHLIRSIGSCVCFHGQMENYYDYYDRTAHSAATLLTNFRRWTRDRVREKNILFSVIFDIRNLCFCLRSTSSPN